MAEPEEAFLKLEEPELPPPAACWPRPPAPPACCCCGGGGGAPPPPRLIAVCASDERRCSIDRRSTFGLHRASMEREQHSLQAKLPAGGEGAQCCSAAARAGQHECVSYTRTPVSSPYYATSPRRGDGRSYLSRSRESTASRDKHVGVSPQHAPRPRERARPARHEGVSRCEHFFTVSCPPFAAPRTTRWMR